MVTVGKSGFPYLRRPLCLCWVPVCLCCRYLYPFVMGTCMLVLLIPLCLCCGYLQVLGSLCGYCGYLCVTVGYCGYLCEYWEVSLGFHSVRHVLGFGMLHISFPTYRNGLFVLFGWLVGHKNYPRLHTAMSYKYELDGTTSLIFVQVQTWCRRL